MKINYLLSQVGSLMIPFDEFQTKFFNIFTTSNFYEGKSYLEYVAEPQTNDEDNIVDTKIVLPLLMALGFEVGDISKNLSGGTKDNTRPDFQVCLAEGNIRCFLVEDKHTAYDLSKPEPLQQLLNYAPIRGYELGFLCNGKLLLGWDLSDPSLPNPVLHLDIEQIIETYSGQNLLAGGKTGLEALQENHIQDLKSLYRRFHQQNFANIENLIQELSKPENEWLKFAISQSNNSNFDELLIKDLKAAINLLEEDILYQLNLFLEEYDQYITTKYLPNGNGNGQGTTEEEETVPKILTRLKQRIMNYLRVYGVLELEDFRWAEEKLMEFMDSSRGSIDELGNKFLKRLIQGERKKDSQEKNKSSKTEKTVQLDLIPNISPAKQQELGIKTPVEKKITKLSPKLVDLLREYERIVFDWKAWQAKQGLSNANAIKTHQHFISWCNLVTKTIFQGLDERRLKEEFARQTAYVYVIRLFMVRICEDKKLIGRKFSDGGFRYWKEEVEPRYLDLAQGVSMDYLLEMSYRSAQNIYAHFFNKDDLFNWYRVNTNTLIKVLHILNRFNLQEIDSDIIGMVYGRYVEEGKHEQGRYFTPKNVVEYILDSIGYTADNPDIRDKTLLDLAGGSGSFLVHAARRLIETYRSKKTNKIPNEYVSSIIQQVKKSLFCLDINPFACYLAETNLLIQVVDLLKQAKEVNQLRDCRIDRFNIYNTDSLLLPKSQEVRTLFLNPILDIELSTVSQIKTKTGQFSEGFDFVVGNPPYVKADEPGVDSYRREIEQTGRFETLHEKWDLFIPFVELACKSTKLSGKIGLIVSKGIQTNNYGDLLRQYIAQNLTISQVNFFNNVRIFSDAVVNNTIFCLDNIAPTEDHQVKRILHTSSFENLREIESLNQIEKKDKVFRQFVVADDFDNVIDLEDICYCTIGMVLNADETVAKGAFKKDDLLSKIKDAIHPQKYIDGENIIREFCLDKVRYLEWGTTRVPDQIRRATIPELYNLSKILFGMTSFPTYDRGLIEGDGFYVPDSVRICVRWDQVYSIKRLASEKRQMYEISKKQQKLLGDSSGKKIQIYEYAKDKVKLAKQFDLRYIAAILSSSFGKRFLLLNNRDENIMTVGNENKMPKSRIYPDDLKEFPIKNITPKKQLPFIERVNALIQWNWELSDLNNSGHTIKFSVNDTEPTIKIDFLQMFNQLNLPCWNFLNAEPQRFEVIGDRAQGINRIKLQNNLIFNGKEEFIQSDSLMVLEFLKNYLPQYEKRGLTWTNLLSEGKIPKTDADIQRIFTEQENLKNEIQHKIESIRQTYKELDEMVTKLYENRSNS